MDTSTEDTAVTRPLLAAGGTREVFALAYPVVLTQISATTMGIVDSAMVGRLGATELAAVGFGAIWLWTIFSLFYGTASGVQTFVAQLDGAGHPRECGRWAWHGAYALVPAAALAAALLVPWLEPLLALLGPSAELQTQATAYVIARLPGEVAFTLVMVLTSFFRGFGDTKTPMYVTIFTNVVNVVLDYGLIFGALGLPEWGTAGAGVATAVAHWIGAAALFAAFRRQKLTDRFATGLVRPNWSETRRLMRTGLPIGGQWCVGMTSFAVFTTVVARMGDQTMAASQAFVMLLSLSFMQAVGISIAASTLAGRYVGARNLPAVERSYRSALTLGIGVAGLVALLFVVIPGPLLRIFTDDPAVVALGRPLLLLGAYFQLCDAVVIVSEGALRGAGDTRWPFVAETILGWGVFVPLAYFLGVTLEGGLTGAWAGGTVSITILASLMVRRFRSGAWRHIRI